MTPDEIIRAIGEHVDGLHTHDLSTQCVVCRWNLTQHPVDCARCGRPLEDAGHTIMPAVDGWHGYIAQDTAARILANWR